MLGELYYTENGVKKDRELHAELLDEDDLEDTDTEPNDFTNGFGPSEEIDELDGVENEDEDEENYAQKRTLYVSRSLLNADEFISWAKSQGFGSTLQAEDIHVTVAFSRAAVDWAAAGGNFDEIRIPAGSAGRDVIPLSDKGAVVLKFASHELSTRWQEFLDAGASWDHEGYRPYVTITYSGGGVDLDTVEPFAGELIFGPERYAEVEEDWNEKIVENAQERAPKGSPIGGQWVSTKGGAISVTSDIPNRAATPINPEDLKSIRSSPKSANSMYKENNAAGVEWHKNLTEDERATFTEYQNHGFGRVNKALRSDAPIDTTHLDKALEKSVMPADTYVMRAMTNPSYSVDESGIRSIAEQYNDSVGKIVFDKGFGSTTLNPRIVEKFSENSGPLIVVKAKIPKGYKGAVLLGAKQFMKDMDYSKKGESEIIVKRNAPFRVNSVKRVGARVVLVEGEYV